MVRQINGVVEPPYLALPHSVEILSRWQIVASCGIAFLLSEAGTNPDNIMFDRLLP